MAFAGLRGLGLLLLLGRRRRVLAILRQQLFLLLGHLRTFRYYRAMITEPVAVEL